MRISRWVAAAAAVLLAGGLGIAGAPPASASSYSVDPCQLEIGSWTVLDGDVVIVVVPPGSECGLQVLNATEPVMVAVDVSSGDVCYAYGFNASTLAMGTGGAVGVHISTSLFATLGDAPQTACGGAAAGGGEVAWTELTKDYCKDGAWKGLGFTNQGQCIASIEANPNAGKT